MGVTMRYIFLVFALLLSPACHTVQGVGEDLQVVGHGIQHLAGEINDEVFNRGKPKTNITVYQPRTATASSLRYPYASQSTSVASNGVGTQRATYFYTPNAQENCDAYGNELEGGNLPACRATSVTQGR